MPLLMRMVNKVVQERPEWIEYDGKRIYEAII
jgi:hypothetical protein